MATFDPSWQTIFLFAAFIDIEKERKSKQALALVGRHVIFSNLQLSRAPSYCLVINFLANVDWVLHICPVYCRVRVFVSIFH